MHEVFIFCPDLFPHVFREAWKNRELEGGAGSCDPALTPPDPPHTDPAQPQAEVIPFRPPFTTVGTVEADCDQKKCDWLPCDVCLAPPLSPSRCCRCVQASGSCLCW